MEKEGSSMRERGPKSPDSAPKKFLELSGQHRRTQSLSQRFKLKPKSLPKNFQDQIKKFEKGILSNNLSTEEITKLLHLYQKGVEYYESKQDPIYMKYHCKMKSVLLLIAHNQKINNEQNIGHVVMAEIKPIFDRIKTNSHNKASGHHRTNSINSRRLSILEELGSRKMSLKSIAVQNLVSHFSEQMEEGEEAIRRNLNEQEDALRQRIHLRKATKDLVTISPQKEAMGDLIDNAMNVLATQYTEGLDSTLEDEQELDAITQINDMSEDIFCNDELMQEIDYGINRIMQNMQRQLDDIEEEKILQIESILEELSMKKMNKIEKIKNEFDPKIKENDGQSDIKQKMADNLRIKREEMIKSEREEFERAKNERRKEMMEEYEKKKQRIHDLQREEAFQSLMALSSPSGSSVSSEGFFTPTKLLSPMTGFMGTPALLPKDYTSEKKKVFDFPSYLSQSGM